MSDPDSISLRNAIGQMQESQSPCIGITTSTFTFRAKGTSLFFAQIVRKEG